MKMLEKIFHGAKQGSSISYEPVKFDAILKLKGEHYSPEIKTYCNG